MKNLSIAKITLNMLLMAGILFFGSCKNGGNEALPVTEATTESAVQTESAIIEPSLIIGSWKDKSEAALDFSMLEDGAARSDNMKTLVYKTWKLNADQLTLVFESIGNGTSSIDSTTYKIEKLTSSDLILRDGTYLSEYTKK